MIGAYVTYVVQTLFRAWLPGWLDWYVAAALPLAFLVTALVGMALERTVIRWLYGRPLETLLATWGISLMLMQGVRSLFGAQSVEVGNPGWMSGGVTVLGGLVLSYNRLVIIGFALAVVALVWVLLNHAPGPVRARHHAEPAHGRLHRRAHRTRGHAGLRPGLGHRRAGRRGAVAAGQCGPGPGARLHRRFVHGGGAGRRGPAGRHRHRRAGPGRRQQIPGTLCGSGHGQDHHPGAYRAVCAKAAARPVRPARPGVE